MTTASPSLTESLQKLVQSWTRQGVACPPMLPSCVRAATASNIVLPPDFVQLYSTANGTPDLYPNEMDENYCSFLPVEALRAATKEWLIISDERATLERVNVIAFVDFMHLSWEYGLITAANGKDYQIGIMPGNNEFKVLATSLAIFLQWYVEDADILYDYSHPFSELGRSAQFR